MHRVAYLLKCLRMDPKKIIVATFTNKAARELKERVATLVEPELAGQLILGTFHHILVNFLRRYGGWMNLKKFNIVDQEDAYVCFYFAVWVHVRVFLTHNMQKRHRPRAGGQGSGSCRSHRSEYVYN